MGYLITGLAAILALCVVFVPAFMILVAAVRYSRVMSPGASWAIAVGALLLTLLSLDVLYPLIFTLGLGLDAQQLANLSVVLAYVMPAARYVALLLIGIGMLIHSKRLASLALDKRDWQESPDNR